MSIRSSRTLLDDLTPTGPDQAWVADLTGTGSPLGPRRSIESTQYASRAYRERLEEHGSRGSMTRRGNPCDNALVESFFKTLKHEEVQAFEYETVEDVLERLPRFLEEVYNRRRLHSALGSVPPEEFETVNRSPAAQDDSLTSDCPTAGGHSTSSARRSSDGLWCFVPTAGLPGVSPVLRLA